MSALRKISVVETRETWTPVVIEGSRTKAVEKTVAAPAAGTGGLIKNMALFLSAPFIGLLYAILLPFVGLGMLAWFAGKALYETGKVHKALRIAKRVLMVAAAPFVGLAYLIVLPFAGLGMLAWFGVAAVAAPARVK